MNSLHDLYKGLMDAKLGDLIFMASFIAYPALGKAMYAGWSIRDTDPVSRLIITQRKRYAFLAFGQLLMVGAAAMLLINTHGSVPEIIAGVQKIYGMGFYGYILGSGPIVVAISPIVTILAVVHIYRKPAEMASKRFRKAGNLPVFATTDSVRRGGLDLAIPVTTLTSGRPERQFVTAKVR